MTNTVSSVFSSITGDMVDVFDGMIGFMVTFMAISVVLAIIAKMVPKKRKVV